MSGAEEDDRDPPSLDNLGNKIKKINELLAALSEKNKILNEQVKNLTFDNDELFNKLYYLEIKCDNLDQYSRRSNIEIQNVPENIHQRDLESYVLAVMASINVHLVSYDIAAVHR